MENENAYKKLSNDLNKFKDLIYWTVALIKYFHKCVFFSPKWKCVGCGNI